MPPRESLLDVIGALLRRRRLWLGIVGAAFVLSVVVALALPVWYVATTVFQAASPDQNNYSKLFTGEQVEFYGSGNDLERVIAAAESEATIGWLIDSFDLYSVYGIDRDDRRAGSEVRDELLDHYRVERTPYSEIELSVEDRDPARAAAMANAARERCASVLHGNRLAGQREMQRMFAASVTNKERRARELSDSLRFLADRSGILDVTAQREALAGIASQAERQLLTDSLTLATLRDQPLSPRLRDTLAVLRARIASTRGSRTTLQEELGRFTSSRDRIEAITAEQRILDQQAAYDRERTRQLQSLIDQPGPVIYLSTEARVPDRKARPVRWLIVVGSTLAAAIFAALGILVWDTYKDVPWSRYLRD